MTTPNSHTLRLILLPAGISLAITLLRLAGEMRHWSDKWFNTDTGGVVPSGVSWVIGITWLAVPFGIYFAFKLVSAGEGPPPKVAKALAMAGVGLLMLVGLQFLFLFLRSVPFPQMLIFVWLWMAAGAVIQWFGWPGLFRVLLAYGFAARIPVAVVMLLAMIGNWGTHYDYLGKPQMPLLSKYLWLAFFPQLVFWVGFTIIAGSIAGTVTAAIILRRHRTAQQAHA